MRLIMMGTGTFAEPTFAALLEGGHEVVALFTQPERAGGKERSSSRQMRHGMKEMAVARGVPVHQPDSVNAAEGVEAVKQAHADLYVVAAYGQILSAEVLGAARLGGINVHASLLPKYRGAAPINWAIYNGEEKTGVTIIRMSTALDAGDILAQQAIDIQPEETAGELEERLATVGTRLACDIVERLSRGPVEGQKQDASQATRAPKLTKEHGLIDWWRAAGDICNQVRAMQPWPTAYSFLHRPGEEPLRVLIQRARVALEMTIYGYPAPGQVRADPQMGQLFIEAGSGEWVEVVELQPAGKRRMTAEEFLNGYEIPQKSRMGAETPTT
jgi:methionyl-tRNA formyltransferase